MIFWNEYNDYTIIENENLGNLAMDYNITLLKKSGLDKKTEMWLNYAHIVSARNHFNVVYEVCFIYYVTLFFADDGISAGAEEEYFKKKLDKHIFNLYTSTVNNHAVSNEIDKKVIFFYSLLNFFNGNDIKHFERKIFQHSIRVSKKIKNWFIESGNIRETIIGLMNKNIRKPHLNMNDPAEDTLVFLLSYSEETTWRSLSKINDGDRLRVLLY